MQNRNFKMLTVTFVCGVVAGTLISTLSILFPSSLGTVQAEPPFTRPRSPTLAELVAEVERLKRIVPDQAHAMSDVDYHFSNLWFAGKAENWPLAEFYWKESLSHMHWAVRIIPVRKDNAGNEVKLEDILQSIENADHLKMGDVIKAKDSVKFEMTYRSLIESCYSCHKAADKPYLRPHIPEQPSTSIITFDPNAKWPL